MGALWFVVVVVVVVTAANRGRGYLGWMVDGGCSFFPSSEAGEGRGGVIKSDMELELQSSVFLADQARPPEPGLRCIVVRRGWKEGRKSTGSGGRGSGVGVSC